MIIREEKEADRLAIGALNRRTFGGDYEAQLIDQLRAAHLIVASLVALDGNEVIGHLLFSSLPVEIDGRDVNAVALAPMAVSPDRQRQGIGSKLVTEGLALLRKKQVEAVIVLGHTAYYPRFGFSPLLTQKLASPFRGMGEFMALELVVGSLAGQKGSVKYPEAFGLAKGHPI
ncbi:MAG: N-acetyltransferase [Acidobacteriia bacterium]|nr:N-acetyltransferase [Terriglobia bacterium]